MRQRVDIAAGAGGAQVAHVLSWLIGVLIDAGAVVGQAHADGEAPTIIGGADVLGVGRLALQGRTVRAAGNGIHFGGSVAVIGEHAEAAEPSGEHRETLLIGDFEAVEVGVAGIDPLGNQVALVRTAGGRVGGADQRVAELLGE
jgi:hypothetical protein